VTRIARTFVAVLGVTLAFGTPAMSSGNQGSASVSAGSRVAITVTGRGLPSSLTDCGFCASSS
jgi:hypothetical protein